MYNESSGRRVYDNPYNTEMLKSLYGEDSGPKSTTDYQNDGGVATGNPWATPGEPVGRESGCLLFRRYPGGQLDVEGAAQLVIDAVHRFKEKVVLSAQESLALQVMFPSAGFGNSIAPGMESAMMHSSLKIQDFECALIRARVTAHLLEELNWNAGNGGGSIPGRSSTYSP